MKMMMTLKNFLFSSVLLLSAAIPGRAHAAADSYLEIFLATSTKYIDWSSPRSLFLTYAPSQIEAEGSKDYNLHPMGHTLGHFVCTDTHGAKHDRYAALTGQNIGKVDTDNLFKKRYGLLTLILAYDDGNIEPTSEVKNLLASYRGRMEKSIEDGTRQPLPIKFLRFPIATPAECDAIVAYHQAFYELSHEQPDVETSAMLPSPEAEAVLLGQGNLAGFPAPGKLWFGLNQKPYELYRNWQAQGGGKAGNPAFLAGGCSSFMTGFLQVVGLYDPAFDDLWMRKIRIHNRLMADQNHGVTPDQVIGTVQGGSWEPKYDASDASLPTYDLSFWDPERMWDFIDTVGACAADRAGTSPAPHFNRCAGPARDWFTARTSGSGSLAIHETALDMREPALAENSMQCEPHHENCAAANPIFGLDLR
jgi:hypothetical protein